MFGSSSCLWNTYSICLNTWNLTNYHLLVMREMTLLSSNYNSQSWRMENLMQSCKLPAFGRNFMQRPRLEVLICKELRSGNEICKSPWLFWRSYCHFHCLLFQINKISDMLHMILYHPVLGSEEKTSSFGIIFCTWMPLPLFFLCLSFLRWHIFLFLFTHKNDFNFYWWYCIDCISYHDVQMVAWSMEVIFEVFLKRLVIDSILTIIAPFLLNTISFLFPLLLFCFLFLFLFLFLFFLGILLFFQLNLPFATLFALICRRFGTWPVAMLSQSKNKVILEGPICNGTEVIGWHSDQIQKISKRFSLDISGFAFNSTILWDPKRWRRPTLEPIRLYDTVKGLQVSSLQEFMTLLMVS